MEIVVKVNGILEKMAFLQLLDKRDWIDGGPHPMYRVSSAIYEMMVAQVVRSIAPLLGQRELGASLHEVGRAVAGHASRGMIAGWEDGDDICPPIDWPHGWHVGTTPDGGPAVVGTVPDTAPALLEHLSGGVRDLVLASAIRTAAGLVSDEKLSLALKQVGEQVVERVAGKGALFDDYCGTPVRPRPPKLGGRTHAG